MVFLSPVSHTSKLVESYEEGICCCCLVAQSCPTLSDPMECSTPVSPSVISQSLLKLMSIESVMPSNHLILCHPLLLLPSIFPSIRVFSKELALHISWPNYWSFSYSISSSNEYSGLISLGLTGLISLLSKGLSRVFSSTTILLEVGMHTFNWEPVGQKHRWQPGLVIGGWSMGGRGSLVGPSP